MQPDEKINLDLQHQLRNNWKKIGKQYASYTLCICTSLQEKGISTKNLTTFLLKIPALKNASDEEQYRLLTGLRMELREAADINDIIDLLDERCASVLDYDIFQSIVDEFKLDHNNTDENKEKLNYPKHLKEFIEKHKLSEFIKINPELSRYTSNSEEVCLTFDINLSKYRLKNVAELKSTIADILKIQPSSLRLFRIEDGCVKMTFLLPSSVAHYIFPSDKKFSGEQIRGFLALKTQWLTCCNFSFNFRQVNLKDEDQLNRHKR